MGASSPDDCENPSVYYLGVLNSLLLDEESFANPKK